METAESEFLCSCFFWCADCNRTDLSICKDFLHEFHDIVSDVKFIPDEDRSSEYEMNCSTRRF